MERFAVTATINGGLTQRPILEANETSSFSQKSQFRDPSFSLNLRQEELKFPIEDTELSIFDAQKYFDEGQDQNERKKNSPESKIVENCESRISSVSSVDRFGRNYRTGSSNATPTASSEASWNSQTGLLSNPPGLVSVSMKNLQLNEKKRIYSSSIKWFFGRKCPCSCKKSVQVRDNILEPKIAVHTNPKSAKEKAKEMKKSLDLEDKANLKLMNGNLVKEKEETRNSGVPSPENHSPAENGRRIVPTERSFNDAGGFSFPKLNPPIDCKLLLNGGKPATTYQPESPIPSEIDRRSFIFPVSPKTRTGNTDDDVASDASSDLFEIESFSTQTTMYRRRESLDEIFNYDARRFNGTNGNGNLHFRQSLDETATPTECYEPSEVSIDWSVTTAEGFDRNSVTNFSMSASDYDDFRFGQPESDKVVPGVTIGIGGGKMRGNGLLNCRCEKAVNVGPHPVKFVPEQRRSPVGSRSIPVGSSLASLSSTQMTHGSSKPPLARSNSARMSRAFVTHN